MNCEIVRGRLNAYVDRELSAPQALKVWGHLTQCSECRKFLAQYRRLTFLASGIRTVRQPMKPSLRILKAGFASSILLLALLMGSHSLAARAPRGIVYDQRAISGRAVPISEIYEEGDHLVVKDVHSGAVLARASGKTGVDAYHAVSDAEKSMPSQIDLSIKAVHPPRGINPKLNQEIFILKGDAPAQGIAQPVIVFFTGDIVELKGIDFPNGEHCLFVKILDPHFFENMNAKSVDFEVRPDVQWRPARPELDQSKNKR